jgi:hypothetical protein
VFKSQREEDGSSGYDKPFMSELTGKAVSVFCDKCCGNRRHSRAGNAVFQKGGNVIGPYYKELFKNSEID